MALWFKFVLINLLFQLFVIILLIYFFISIMSRRATRSSGIPLSPVALSVKSPKKRNGLRSGGRITAARQLVLSKARQEKAKKAAAAAKKAQVASSLTDFSSDDDEPLATKAKTKASKSDMIHSNTKQVGDILQCIIIIVCHTNKKILHINMHCYVN